MAEQPARPGRTLLAVIGLIALLRGLLWSSVVPVWYGPDEITHFDYVQVLATQGRLVRFDVSREDGLDVPLEVRCSLPHLGFGVDGGFLGHPHPERPSRCIQSPQDSDPRRQPVATNPAGGYGPLYYALAVPFWELAAKSSVEDRVHSVRLLSILLGVLAAVFALLAAWEAFGGRRGPALAAALLFALQPMNAQQFAVVNNDALLYAVAGAFFWRLFVAVRLGRGEGMTDREAMLLGGLAGLAYLAKPHGVFLIAGMLVPLWGVLRARGWLAALRAAVAAAAPVGLAIAGQAAFSAFFNGSGLVSAVPVAAGRHGLHDYLDLMLLNRLERPYELLVLGTWGQFEWVSAQLPRILYPVALAFTLAGLAAPFLVRQRVMLAAGLTVALVGGGIIALEAATYRSLGALPLSGRSFLELLVPMTVLAVAGITSLLPKGARGAGRVAIVAFALATNLDGLASIVQANYS